MNNLPKINEVVETNNFDYLFNIVKENNFL